MKKVLLVKYGEIALRGNNRYIFEDHIRSAIRKRIKPFGDFYVPREQGRILVEAKEGDVDYEKIIPLITKIFGIYSFFNPKHISSILVVDIKKYELITAKKPFNISVIIDINPVVIGTIPIYVITFLSSIGFAILITNNNKNIILNLLRISFAEVSHIIPNMIK